MDISTPKTLANTGDEARDGMISTDPSSLRAWISHHMPDRAS